MDRNQLGLRAGEEEKIWAETGDNSTPIPIFEKGYGIEYQESVYPDRRHLNNVLAYATAAVNDMNKGGSGLGWDISIEYDVGAMVLASDGLFHICLKVGNSGKNPTVPSEASTFWTTLAKTLLLDKILDDTEHLEITAHNSELISNSGSGNTDYDISGFIGDAELVTSEIRGLFVEYSYTYREGGNTLNNFFGLQATLPWSEEYVNIKTYAAYVNNGEARVAFKGIAFIPISKGQSTIGIRNYVTNVGATTLYFKILGATQRCAGDR